MYQIKQIQTDSVDVTENMCRKITVRKKYITHIEGNLAQEKSSVHDEITLGYTDVYG